MSERTRYKAWIDPTSSTEKAWRLVDTNAPDEGMWIPKSVVTYCLRIPPLTGAEHQLVEMHFEVESWFERKNPIPFKEVGQR